MNDYEQSKQRLELLKMARELLNEEYINRRAEDHNQWIADCDVEWRTRRVKLPYPPFAPYPTEAEIVAKALALYNFVSATEVAAPEASPSGLISQATMPTPTPVVKSSPVPELSDLQKELKAAAGPKFKLPINTTIDSPWKTYLAPADQPAPTIEPIVDPIVEPVTVAPVAAPIVAPLVPSIDPTMATPWNTHPIPTITTIQTNPSTIDAVEELTADSAETISTTTVPATAIQVEQTSGGIKNFLPGWLQRNQTTNKGSLL